MTEVNARAQIRNISQRLNSVCNAKESSILNQLDIRAHLTTYNGPCLEIVS